MGKFRRRKRETTPRRGRCWCVVVDDRLAYEVHLQVARPAPDCCIYSHDVERPLEPLNLTDKAADD